MIELCISLKLCAVKVPHLISPEYRHMLHAFAYVMSQNMLKYALNVTLRTFPCFAFTKMTLIEFAK